MLHKYTEDDIVRMINFLIDDIFVECGGEIFQQVIGIPMASNCDVYVIYPVELEIKETTDDQYHSSFLDLLLEIDKDSRLRVKIYDKRDDLNYDNVNFPFLVTLLKGGG